VGTQKGAVKNSGTHTANDAGFGLGGGGRGVLVVMDRGGF